jgi:outer membrane lipoprotein SlyB
MPSPLRLATAALSMALATACGSAWAQSSVSYGRITAVNVVNQASTGAQAGGALLGGTLGLISGSGQSGSNRALRTIGGGVAGQQLGRMSSQRTAFEYTILVGGRTTVQIVTDEAGLRIGDCVAVERGAFNNLRLVDDARCATNAGVPQTAVREADACSQAKDALLRAETDEAFDRAERRVRLLCAD